MQKINVQCFLAVKVVFSAINQPFALKRLSSLEILVICVREIVSPPPPPLWVLAAKINRYASPTNFDLPTP